MSERELAERLRQHWRLIATSADFNDQPIWRVAETPTFVPTIASADTSPNANIEFHYFEYCQKPLYDRQTGERVARAVFGRKPPETEWVPLDEIPHYLVVGC